MESVLHIWHGFPFHLRGGLSSCFYVVSRSQMYIYFSKKAPLFLNASLYETVIKNMFLQATMAFREPMRGRENRRHFVAFYRKIFGFAWKAPLIESREILPNDGCNSSVHKYHSKYSYLCYELIID